LLLGTLLFGVLLLWSYWPVFAEMASKWISDPQYSHAYLVPAFSLWLAWIGWRKIDLARCGPCWWGVLFLAAGIALRLVGARFYVDWLEAISLLPLLGGCVLLLGGWPALRQLSPAIAFLGFMIPLPYRIETGLSQPLQRLATAGSTYVLQTLGRPAFAEGNIIVINDARIGVIEACNGLGMFLLFFAMATAVALLIRRPLWEKIVLVMSAAPIAVGVNVARITLSGLAHELIGTEWADAIFHDFAGWLMMPLALVALGVEAKVLAKLFREVSPSTRTLPVMPAVHNPARGGTSSARGEPIVPMTK
jgi:exosortase